MTLRLPMPARGRRDRTLLAMLVLALIVSACSSTHGDRARGPTPGTSSSRSPTQTPASSTVNVYANALAGRFSPAVAGITERVYVPDSSGNTLWVIDPKTFKVTKQTVPANELQHVTPAWDLSKLYVDDAGTGALTVIDPKTGLIGKTIRNVPDPYNLYFTPDGSKAIVVAEEKRRLDFRNPRTWKLIKSVGIPWAGVDHMDFTADGRYLLTSTEYAGVLVKVDTVKMQVEGTLKVGGKPIDVRLAPDGKVFFVPNQGRHGVSIVDPVSMKEVKFIRTGRGAHGVAVSRDTKSFYVSNRIAGTISVIDLAHRRVVATWKVGGSPDMLQVSPNGRYLWVSNRFDASVTVVDTKTGRIAKLIHLGGTPHGLCYFPQPGRISLGHNGVYR